MNIEEIKALFPITTMVTQEIINKSSISSIWNCIGANTLKSCVPIELQKTLHWGRSSGFVYATNDDDLRIKSNIDMMEITEPIEVTFIIEA